jgi:hypothetical protein
MVGYMKEKIEINKEDYWKVEAFLEVMNQLKTTSLGDKKLSVIDFASKETVSIVEKILVNSGYFTIPMEKIEVEKLVAVDREVEVEKLVEVEKEIEIEKQVKFDESAFQKMVTTAEQSFLTVVKDEKKLDAEVQKLTKAQEAIFKKREEIAKKIDAAQAKLQIIEETIESVGLDMKSSLKKTISSQSDKKREMIECEEEQELSEVVSNILRKTDSITEGLKTFTGLEEQEIKLEKQIGINEEKSSEVTKTLNATRQEIKKPANEESLAKAKETETILYKEFTALQLEHKELSAKQKDLELQGKKFEKLTSDLSKAKIELEKQLSSEKNQQVKEVEKSEKLLQKLEVDSKKVVSEIDKLKAEYNKLNDTLEYSKKYSPEEHVAHNILYKMYATFTKKYDDMAKTVQKVEFIKMLMKQKEKLLGLKEQHNDAHLKDLKINLTELTKTQKSAAADLKKANDIFNKTKIGLTNTELLIDKEKEALDKETVEKKIETSKSKIESLTTEYSKIAQSLEGQAISVKEAEAKFKKADAEVMKIQKFLNQEVELCKFIKTVEQYNKDPKSITKEELLKIKAQQEEITAEQAVLKVAHDLVDSKFEQEMKGKIGEYFETHQIQLKNVTIESFAQEDMEAIGSNSDIE